MIPCIYLQSLILLGIVQKEHPAGDEKSRKSIYLLEDHLKKCQVEMDLAMN